MKLQIAILLASAAAASASWTKNLNYRSPSEHHPFMGIAIHKVVRRTNYASPFNASQLNFTHGVASGDPYPNSVILVRSRLEAGEDDAADHLRQWTRISPVYDDDKSNGTEGYSFSPAVTDPRQ